MVSYCAETKAPSSSVHFRYCHCIKQQNTGALLKTRVQRVKHNTLLHKTNQPTKRSAVKDELGRLYRCLVQFRLENVFPTLVAVIQLKCMSNSFSEIIESFFTERFGWFFFFQRVSAWQIYRPQVAALVHRRLLWSEADDFMDNCSILDLTL